MNFSRAAEHMGMSQPGVSYQVASLERSLELKLFTRGARSVTLTSAGLYFCEQLRRITAAYQGMVDHVRSLSPEGEEPGTDGEAFLDLRQLECFLAVVHRQNFTKAGEDIFLTQSGISYQIASLEKSLGRKLFHRGARSLSLSEPGEVFARQARELVEDYHAVLKKAQELSAQVGGALSVGFLGVVFMDLVPRLLREFAAECPGVEVKRVHVTLAHAFDAILNGEIDCTFSMLFNHVCPPGILTHVILKDRMLAAMSADHPFAHRKKLKLSELKGQPLLSITPQIAGPGVEWHRALCEKHGLDYGLTRFAPDFPTMFLDISMGSGIAIQPGRTIQEYGNASHRVVELEDEGMDIEFVVAWKEEGANPLVPLFLRCFDRL